MHIETINELFRLEGFDAPPNPLFGMEKYEDYYATVRGNDITYGFYSISFTRLKSKQSYFGRTKYDGTMGFMHFSKPGQCVPIHEMISIADGFSIYFHEKLLAGHPLSLAIRNYGIFEYSKNEALHLTQHEYDIVWDMFQKGYREYNGTHDQFSKTIVLVTVASLLKFTRKMTVRQLKDRQVLLHHKDEAMKEFLDSYIAAHRGASVVVPPVEDIASELGMTTAYLNDAMWVQYKKGIKEVIQQFMAKRR